MIKKTIKSQGFRFYLIGLLVNLIFVIVLYSGEKSFINLQVPENLYANNIWASCSDVMSYVNPARNFVEYGVVGYKLTPDHFRTVGYPVFIGLFMKLSPTNWLYLLIAAQAILFAFFYPIILGLYTLVFPDKGGGNSLIWFMLLTGVYWVRTAQVLTDTIFALGLLSGVYFGLKYFVKRKWIYALLYILIITIAALIRPTLSLFFFINLLLAWISLGIGNSNTDTRWLFRHSVFLSIVFIFSCNFATFRNIRNYNFSSPSSVVSLNIFEYLGKRVLLANDQKSRYVELNDSISKLPDIRQIADARKNVTIKIVQEYPISTAKEIFVKNAVNLLLSNHFENVGNYYGYSWKKPKPDSVCYPYMGSKLLYWMSYFLMLVYALIFGLFLYSMFLLLRTRNFALFSLLALLFCLFVIPGMITGSGGARFRLPFEGFLLLVVFGSISRQPLFSYFRLVRLFK